MLDYDCARRNEKSFSRLLPVRILTFDLGQHPTEVDVARNRGINRLHSQSAHVLAYSTISWLFCNSCASDGKWSTEHLHRRDILEIRLEVANVINTT